MANSEHDLPAESESASAGEAEALARASLLAQQPWQVDGDVGVDSVSNPAAGAATEPAPPPPPEEESVPPPPLRIVEAMLFIGGQPLTAARAGDAVRGLTEAQFVQAIETLNENYRRQGRPYTIQQHARGYLLTLRPRFRQVTERLYGGVREVRLSTVAIDVLALVAYRQPATKQEIDSVRGAESGTLLRQLVRRGLIAVVQRGDSAQREVAYGTTPKFLEFFGLRSLEDLPQTQNLQQM